MHGFQFQLVHLSFFLSLVLRKSSNGLSLVLGLYGKIQVITFFNKSDSFFHLSKNVGANVLSTVFMFLREVFCADFFHVQFIIQNLSNDLFRHTNIILLSSHDLSFSCLSLYIWEKIDVQIVIFRFIKYL